MAPKSVTFRRHDHLVSVLFGDLHSHSYNITFSMFLYLVKRMSGTEALAANLDSDNKIMAAQDFRHTIQFERESVSDFIRRLERAFRIAYDPNETRSKNIENVML